MSSSSSGSSGDDAMLGRSVSQASSGNSGGSGSSGDCEVDSNEGSAEGSEGTATSFCGLMEEVLRDAFLKTDEEFSNSGLQAGLVGSTAVVALVGTHRVWIANCGELGNGVALVGRMCWVRLHGLGCMGVMMFRLGWGGAGTGSLAGSGLCSNPFYFFG
jgi:hypothetical protein